MQITSQAHPSSPDPAHQPCIKMGGAGKVVSTNRGGIFNALHCDLFTRHILLLFDFAPVESSSLQWLPTLRRSKTFIFIHTLF